MTDFEPLRRISEMQIARARRMALRCRRRPSFILRVGERVSAAFQTIYPSFNAVATGVDLSLPADLESETANPVTASSCNRSDA
jgi:hypothetical protein